MEFTYPGSLSELREIEGVSQLKGILKQQQQVYEVPKLRLKIIKNERYIYVRCRECSAHLRYKYNIRNHLYNLTKSFNQHRHPVKTNWRKNRIRSFIENIPSSMDLSSARKITTRELNISSSMFYYHYNQIFNPKMDLKELFQALDQQKYEMHSDPWNEDMTVTP